MRALGSAIDWLLRNLVRLLVLGAILFFALTLGVQTCDKEGPKAPDVNKAGYVVTTDSRTYYTDEYDWQGDVLILHGYWSLEGGKWQFNKRDLKLSEAFGKRSVRER